MGRLILCRDNPCSIDTFSFCAWALCPSGLCSSLFTSPSQSHGSASQPFSSCGRRLVQSELHRTYRYRSPSVAGNPGRPARADRGAHGLGQDARSLSAGDRYAGATGPRRPARKRDPGRLRLAPEGAVERHQPQPRNAACRCRGAALRAQGLPDVEIRTWVRTGDTPPGERDRMRKSPPHIVVTTPESLYILLGSESGCAMLKTTRTVIVDEIHALAPNKARLASVAFARGQGDGHALDRDGQARRGPVAGGPVPWFDAPRVRAL